MADEIGYPDDMEPIGGDHPAVPDDAWWKEVLGGEAYDELREKDPDYVVVQLTTQYRINDAKLFIEVVATLLKGLPEDEEAREEYMSAAGVVSSLMTRMAIALHDLVVDAGFDPHTALPLDDDGVPSCHKEPHDG